MSIKMNQIFKAKNIKNKLKNSKLLEKEVDQENKVEKIFI
jgi:hypothetical protein